MKRGLLALLLALALAAAACGSRVEPLPFAQGFPGQPLPGGAVAPGAAAPGQQPIPGKGTVPGGGSGGGGAVAQGPAGGTVARPGTQTSCRGGATDVGVTATTIKVGAVIALTGPLPGQFNSARDAVDSHFKMINEQEGGVCGRKFEFIVRDDNGDSTNNNRAARKLVDEDKVFALVGSHSQSDSGMVPVVCNKGIPDIGFQLDWNHVACKNSFSVPGQIQKNLIGEGASGSKYLNEANGVTQGALFWLRDSEVSVLSAWGFEAAMLKSQPDFEICYEQETSVFETGFDQFVLRMKQRCNPNTTGIYTTMENASNIRLAKAMRAQGFKPKVFAPTFTSYLGSFITDAEGATEGAYIAMPQIPFERCRIDDNFKPISGTCSHPELERFVTALNRYHPGSARPGSFGAPGWGQAGLFVEAVKSCGANLTRRCVLDYLDSAPVFSAGGFLAPNRPADHHIYTLDLLVQVRNGKFVEVPAPAGARGPKDGRDFWDVSDLMDWFKFYCANKSRFPNTARKDDFIPCS